MIKVIIADDQLILRESLKVIIEQNQDLQVVGCAENGREAFELCSRLQPDVVIMDIVMPGSDGVEGTKLIKSKYGSIKVIILTTFGDLKNISSALANGADGYILKDITPEDLIRAIKNVADGFGVIHKKTYETIVNQYGACSGISPVQENMDWNLSDRELQIIRLIIEGKNNREIAANLYLTEGRVKNIISGMLNKLKFKDRTQLVVFAINNNIV